MGKEPLHYQADHLHSLLLKLSNFLVSALDCIAAAIANSKTITFYILSFYRDFQAERTRYEIELTT